MKLQSLIPNDLTLVHTGIVCSDMALAKERLGRVLDVHWVGGELENWSLILYGSPITIPLRIAHASNGQAHFELIEAVQDTPWVTTDSIAQHHLCFHSSAPEKSVGTLEKLGFERIMGANGDPNGYFQDPSGLLVEIIDDTLLAYLEEYYRLSIEGSDGEKLFSE